MIFFMVKLLLAFPLGCAGVHSADDARRCPDAGDLTTAFFDDAAKPFSEAAISPARLAAFGRRLEAP
jgi:hypothetical protein